jgi:hypothetical protein
VSPPALHAGLLKRGKTLEERLFFEFQWGYFFYLHRENPADLWPSAQLSRGFDRGGASLFVHMTKGMKVLTIDRSIDVVNSFLRIYAAVIGRLVKPEKWRKTVELSTNHSR